MSDYTDWIQLEPVAFDKTLATELAAPVADPLWLLARQLQFGEFWHDGGASPVSVAVTHTSGWPVRMRAGVVSGPPVPAGPGAPAATEIALTAAPLDAVAESEPIPGDGLDALRLRAESGLYLQRLLRAAGLDAAAATWAQRCPLTAPPHASLDAETLDWFDSVDGRVPDGNQLSQRLAAITSGQDTTTVLALGELDVLKAWLAGNGIRLHAPSGAGNWVPEQLDYEFSAAALVGSGEVVLAAPEQVEDTLDWHAFDVTTGTLGLTGPATDTATLYRLPVPLRFTGMPSSRFWAFEDPAVNLDTLDLFTSPGQEPSVAAMMALDFALSYGDDWCQVPLPLPAHVVSRVLVVEITDCFGDVVAAQPPAGRWNLFRPDDAAAPNGLADVFINAVPGRPLSGGPLEEVHLLRDEQANLAWAIETVVPHPLNGGVPVTAASPAPPAAAGTGGGAQPADAATGLRWTMAPPSLPANWFPLVPVADPPGRLALGALWTAPDAQPAGHLLGDLLSGHQLYDREVPSEGVQASRRWRAARAADGSLHLWIARGKRPRQIDLAPALCFDAVDT
jgi:hypothetical protein